MDPRHILYSRAFHFLVHGLSQTFKISNFEVFYQLELQTVSHKTSLFPNIHLVSLTTRFFDLLKLKKDFVSSYFGTFLALHQHHRLHPKHTEKKPQILGKSSIVLVTHETRTYDRSENTYESTYVQQ